MVHEFILKRHFPGAVHFGKHKVFLILTATNFFYNEIEKLFEILKCLISRNFISPQVTLLFMSSAGLNVNLGGFFQLNNQLSFSENVPKCLLISNFYFLSELGKT